MQSRERTEAAGVKLSTLGAVIPDMGVTGAKVYTTIQGQFNFVILLFSTQTGAPLATLQANAITRLRTAASSVLAAQFLASPGARRMLLCGAGEQGHAHAVQFAHHFPLAQIDVFDPHVSPQALAVLEQRCGVAVHRVEDTECVQEADIVVTASRSSTALFPGESLAAGTFVAAIGSSLPHTRELDDAALRRASTIAVEWKEQVLLEAGDLILADPAIDVASRLVELGELLTGIRPTRPAGDQIALYKAVGVGLEDIALAGLAYQRYCADR